jgi:uncharacterized repeat protein (TIGR03803 family)
MLSLTAIVPARYWPRLPAPLPPQTAPPFQALYTFTGANDGGAPAGNLIADKSGNLYGTTSEGGPNGAGTVFKLAPDGTETVLYHFTGAADGDLPMSSLLRDSEGNLYGVTEIGGTSMAPATCSNWRRTASLTSIYSFGTHVPPMGGNPICQLIWGPHHDLAGHHGEWRHRPLRHRVSGDPRRQGDHSAQLHRER